MKLDVGFILTGFVTRVIKRVRELDET